MQKIPVYGSSGNKYLFERLQTGNQQTNVAGIYAFVSVTQNGPHILYIGEAQSLSNRVSAQHEKFQSALNLGMNEVWLMALQSSESERKGIEVDLITALKPALNQQHNY